jgi:hypothetical protein
MTLCRPANVSFGPAFDQVLGPTFDQVWSRLAQFTDTVGHRLAGSAAMEAGVGLPAEWMRAEGLEVHAEAAVVPRHWIRGDESAVLLEPVYPGGAFKLALAKMGRRGLCYSY